MRDGFGRTIEYLRVSVTDRCDLRCKYCMPEDGIALAGHSDILTYEEILRIVALAARLGIKKVRLTGGEPLARRNLDTLVAGIKAVDGIKRVCLTTNGLQLSEQLPALVDAGLDGVNISIDALSEAGFENVTRLKGVDKVLRSIDAALSYPQLEVKLNCVPSELNGDEILPMARRFLADSRLSLRFIEMMPIGFGKLFAGVPDATLKELLQNEFGPLTPLPDEPGGGPCSYFSIGNMPGRVGFISALSACFCANCNRIRLTADGRLKACLQYDYGVGLRPLLEGGDEALLEVMKAVILKKPERHRFAEAGFPHAERHGMSQIGG